MNSFKKIRMFNTIDRSGRYRTVVRQHWPDGAVTRETRVSNLQVEPGTSGASSCMPSSPLSRLPLYIIRLYADFSILIFN